jgi:hypothetical protein
MNTPRADRDSTLPQSVRDKRSAASDARTAVGAIENFAGMISNVAMASAQRSAGRRHGGASDAADDRANGAANECAAHNAGGCSRRLLRR